MKRILINASLILLAAICFKTSASAQEAVTGGKSTPANCTGAQLAVREGEPEADIGGKRYSRFVFTNVSAKPCMLKGFPKFGLLNKTGRTLPGVRVSYDNDFPGGESEETSVTLEPDKTAWFQVFYNDGMALGRRKKNPVSAKVVIKAPDTTRAFMLKSVIEACCGVQVSSIRGGLPQ